MLIKSFDDWKAYLSQNWKLISEKVNPEGELGGYELLVFIGFYPLFEFGDLSSMLDLIAKETYGLHLAERIWNLYEAARGKPDAVKLLRNLYRSLQLRTDEKLGVDFLFTILNIMDLMQENIDKLDLEHHCEKIIEDIKVYGNSPAIRVQAEIILSRHKLQISCENHASLYKQILYLQQLGSEAFHIYINNLRAGLDVALFQQIMPGNKYEISLLDTYIPLDVWDIKNVRSVDSILAFENSDEFKRRSALELVSLEPLLVIIGGPGSGKSTFSRNLAVKLSQLIESNSSPMEIFGPLWIHGALLPLFIELKNFAESKDFPDTEEIATFEALLRYIERSNNSFGSNITKLLNTKIDGVQFTTILILDGLDEVSQVNEKRTRLKLVIESWASKFSQCRILVTSRVSSYLSDAKWHLSERFYTAALAPFNEIQVKSYVSIWYIRTLLKETSLLIGRAEAERKAERLTQDFILKVDSLPHLKPLVQTPLMLTLLTLIHSSGKGNFPEGGRAELYEQTIRLLNRWNPPYEKPALVEKLENLNLQKLREVLQVLAYEVHRDQDIMSSPANITEIKLTDALNRAQIGGNKFIQYDLGAPTSAIVEYLKTRNGILISPNEYSFRFLHRSFQEFMSACALREQYNECVLPGTLNNIEEEWAFPNNIISLLLYDYEKWKEVALLLGARLVAVRDADGWWNLLGRLTLDTESELCTLIKPSRETKYRISLLAGDIWLEHQLEPRSNKHTRIFIDLKERLKLIVSSATLTIQERSRAGNILAALGDDRKGVSNTGRIPDIKFIEIPSGSFLMGNNENPDEHPQHTVSIDRPFKIASYPITNAQFNSFISSEDGYRNLDWWDFSVNASVWRRQNLRSTRSQGLVELTFIDNHPKVNVNWYESVAFCRWLSKQINCTVRLPTEAEWEYVARGTDGRQYPWGNNFSPSNLNMIETGIGSTSTVGIFGGNDQPFPGIYDLCGNVEEWCLTSWTEIAPYPYNPLDGRNILSGTSPRVLRGGSFLSKRNRVTTTSRPGGSVETQSKYIGFRVVMEIG